MLPLKAEAHNQIVKGWFSFAAKMTNCFLRIRRR